MNKKWNGFPEDREITQYHWLKNSKEPEKYAPFKWDAKQQRWVRFIYKFEPAVIAAQGWRYGQICPFPEE